MVFNGTFSYIMVIILLLEETGIPEEKHQPATSHWQTLSHNVVSSTPRLSGIRTHNVSDDNKFNYHMIMTMTAPVILQVKSRLFIA